MHFIVVISCEIASCTVHDIFGQFQFPFPVFDIEDLNVVRFIYLDLFISSLCKTFRDFNLFYRIFAGRKVIEPSGSVDRQISHAISCDGTIIKLIVHNIGLVIRRTGIIIDGCTDVHDSAIADIPELIAHAGRFCFILGGF